MALLSQAATHPSLIPQCRHGRLTNASSSRQRSRVALKASTQGAALCQNRLARVKSLLSGSEKTFCSESRRKASRRVTVSAAADGEDPPLSEDETEPPSDVNLEPEDLVVGVGIDSPADYYASSSFSAPPATDDVGDLKQALVDSLYGTERGLRASGETRGEVVELISQLEARNPTPSPTEALDLLDGKWVLAYTSFSELFPLLAAGNLPFVKVGEISQTVDAVASRVDNRVTFSTPLASTSFGASASFQVRSAKRVQVRFEETVIGPPQLPEVPELPTEIEFFGQRVALADLGPIQSALLPLQEAATSALRTLSDQGPLKIPIPGNNKAESWLLTTYLDEDLRISRGDGNSVFVLIKEGSPLLD